MFVFQKFFAPAVFAHEISRTFKGRFIRVGDVMLTFDVSEKRCCDDKSKKILPPQEFKVCFEDRKVENSSPRSSRLETEKESASDWLKSSN